MDWMLMTYKRYADFSGRSRRKEYWMFMLFFLIVYAVCFALMFAGGGFGGYDPATGAATGPNALGMLGIGLLVVFVLGSFIPALAVQVRRDLGVNGKPVGARAREVVEVLLRLDHHQVHVERQRGEPPDGLDDLRAEREVRNETAVHHVDVNQVGSARLAAGDLFREPRKVGAEDRRGNARFHRSVPGSESTGGGGIGCSEGAGGNLETRRFTLALADTVVPAAGD